MRDSGGGSLLHWDGQIRGELGRREHKFTFSSAASCSKRSAQVIGPVFPLLRRLAVTGDQSPVDHPLAFRLLSPPLFRGDCSVIQVTR